MVEIESGSDMLCIDCKYYDNVHQIVVWNIPQARCTRSCTLESFDLVGGKTSRTHSGFGCFEERYETGKSDPYPCGKSARYFEPK